MKKLLAPLLGLIFAAGMFGAGALAPPGMSEPVKELTAHVAALVGGKAASASAPASSAASASASAKASASAPASAGASASASAAASAGAAASAPAAASAAASADDAVFAETLLLPPDLPEGAQVGLQLGLYADAGQAQELGKRIAALKLPYKIIASIDRAGQRWSVVALGPFAGKEEARLARQPAGQELGGKDEMPLILWPKPKA